MSGAIRLSQDALSRLPSDVLVPRYDRAALTPGMVHIGLGNFHRAHMAWYTHRLMQDGLAQDWAIRGAGVRSADAAMRDRLLAQDCLTTLVELDPERVQLEVTGAMVDFVPVSPDNGPLIQAISAAHTRIVSLTVTEGGYYLDPVTGAFDATHDDIAHDAQHPDTPRTAFGAIVAALRLRRDQGTGPLTAMSCDNLLGNGDILRQTLVSLARLSDPGLADWINTACSFPNSMVDCIVPATGPAEFALAQRHGIEDAAPVTHEPFRQWVIEDAFCAGRPPWEHAGATFTDQIHAYETMKIRLLNAGHQVLANAGEILAVETIDGCMAHPSIGALFQKVLTDEIAPHVAAVPGCTPQDYIALISGRFRNPRIRDTVRRVAFDGSSRHTGFLLPTVRDALGSDGPLEGLALVEALWARMCAGTREDGSGIAANDPFWDIRATAAAAARHDPSAWLAQAEIYGDLAAASRFSEAFTRWLALIWDGGTEAAIQSYLSA